MPKMPRKVQDVIELMRLKAKVEEGERELQQQQNMHGSTGFATRKEPKQGILKNKGPKTISFKNSSKEPITPEIKSIDNEDLERGESESRPSLLKKGLQDI